MQFPDAHGSFRRKIGILMDPQPVVAAAVTAAVAAAATLVRSVWAFARRPDRKASREIDLLRPKAAAWLRRAAAHFVGKGLRRQFLLRYSLDIYLQSLYRRHQRLVVPGRVELPIDRCYIPLELRAGQMTEAIQLLSKSGTILLLGDPGTGKSALLSRIIRDLCWKARENKDRARLPVYLPLQHIGPILSGASGTAASPEASFAVLEKCFERLTISPMELFDSGGMLRTFATSQKNGLVVLLDGLDEIAAETIGAVEQFLLDLDQYLSSSRGSNLLIIASRRQALDFAPRLTGGGIQNLVPVELKPFTPAAIYSFLLRWPYPPGKKSSDEARRIFNQLRLNSTLVETCANPLALALYVNHDQRLRDLGPGNLSSQPETRAAFFSDVVDYLMIRTRSDRVGVRSPNRPFRQARTNFFVAVVDHHIRSREPFNAISEKNILRHAAALVKDGQTAEQALYELAKDTGIIVRNDRDETWSFVHRSFLDYFLACSLAAIARKKEIQRLLIGPLKSDPLRYLEGFYLACGLMASRNSLHLQTVLHDLSNSTFVGRYYPRAMLEAQAYFLPQFPERIRFYCNWWQQNQEDPVLFRDLVAVLVDYEQACAALGRKAEVTVVGELGEFFESTGLTALQVAQLDVDLAMKIANHDNVHSILLATSPEDAIVALYEPTVGERVRHEEVVRSPRLAAIVAEAALRSSLFSNSLAPPPRRSFLGRATLTNSAERWVDAWPIRGTRLAGTLAIALPYVRRCAAASQAEFPHLTVLSYIRPVRRLRHEIMFGDPRVGMLLLSIVVLADVPLWFSSLHPWQLALALLPLAVLFLLGFRLLAIAGILSLPSRKVLNLQPEGSDFTMAAERRVRMVSGDRARLRRWRWGDPRSSDGPIVAVYVRKFPFIWRRFSPVLGDKALSLTGGAVVQQMYTEDVRKLLRS
ncbi:NACHT domain-containing protein [Micromonospora sp. FIMYZ51]|uniref:NACHT domain-containing protein n=1 Tax=Micromonospora sp. FIMYZ51 TaxID=3051832 RepID=UPI00311DA2B8